MKIQKVFEDIFFPDGIKCIICDGELDSDNRYGVCKNCKLDYNDNFCEKCGRYKHDDLDYCADCISHLYGFNIARAPVPFNKASKQLIYKLKYGNCRYLAKYMAQYMLDVFVRQNMSADYITFVPMAKSRRRFRGYNQAELLAKEMSLLTGIPCLELLTRVLAKRNLARLGRQDRIKAIRGTISTVEDIVLTGKKVLLIDDVFTSGTTSGECSLVLKEAGALFVSVLTFATAKANEYIPKIKYKD